MEANKVNDSHRPPTDGGMAKEEFIRVGTTLYKIVEQPRLNGGYVRKRIAWNNETLRQDYGVNHIRLFFSVDSCLCCKWWRKAGISAFSFCRKSVSSDCKRSILRTQ